MRRKEREITSKEEMDKIIAQTNVLYLAMSDGDAPYVVPVNFGYDGSSFIIHGAPEGTKIDILKKNPKVALTLAIDISIIPGDIPFNWYTNYKSICAKGIARFLTDPDERLVAMKLLMKTIAGHDDFDFSVGCMNHTALIEIIPDVMTGKRHVD